MYDEKAIRLHEEHRGKIEIRSKVPLQSREDLSVAYTPGVAEPSRRIAQDKELAYRYTIKGNTVAVISDGSAVLGLGNIGAEAAIPVMEGKAAIFKELAGIDAFPICLARQDVQGTIQTIRNIAPVFGGINLEDFKAPECFAIEAALQDLGIPVMHDDQHGTAVVVLAGLTNALRVVGKDLISIRIVINGVGAAGVAITKLLLVAGVPAENILLVDSKGVIYEERTGLTNEKVELSRITNLQRATGSLVDALRETDVFIGVSKPNVLTAEMVRSMATNPIIFALANPTPEIDPALARQAGAAIVATGRSDYPNQINNSLAFPGIFRGALDARATRITTEMKLSAAYAIAELVEPTADEILPYSLDKRVVPAVAKAVREAWEKR